MIFLRLFFEFAKVGLFAVGGGLATIPFLQDMGARTGLTDNCRSARYLTNFHSFYMNENLVLK